MPLSNLSTMFRRLVPARHRARIAVAMQGGRCDPQSQCAQKAQSLIALLLSAPCHHHHSTAAAAANCGLSDAVYAEAIMILDGQQRLLSERRTTALALATLSEAMLRMQEGRAYAAEARERILRILEALEASVASSFSSEDDADHRHHHQLDLLVHLGRGVEYLKARLGCTPGRQTR